MLETGVKAPDLALKDGNGMEVKLSDFAGKKVVLYFYPKDNTPGCTRQACAFRDNYDGFAKRGVAVIGISKDDEASHNKFVQKHNLPFVLPEDPQPEAIKAYEVWQEKTNFGKTSMGIVRTTYIIDENGLIEKVFKRAKPDTNADEILKYLDK
ncbi:MAG: thioredoxin-dependent thiol peroxidase [Defluviitaleaceae bacterium]|nr:thioredoxin-dependent thiol peroxidase [Defluviitaleaceae bacterium]